MTKDFKVAYDTWDEFLAVWPVERVRTMTLEEYTQQGSQDTFTYWLESRLDNCGSIWGGSAFKFGVYSRDNRNLKENASGRSYSEEYAWYSKHGQTPEDAFEVVKGKVLSVIEAVHNNDLDSIEALDFGRSFKWKIAFHYQDRENPIVVNIFREDMFFPFLDPEASGLKMPALQQMALQRRGTFGLLELSEQIVSIYHENNEVNVIKAGAGKKNTVQMPLNTIYHGPPGTGKTYRLNQLKEQFTSRASQMTREQWLAELVEGLKWWEISAVALYDLGGKAKCREIEKHELISGRVATRGAASARYVHSAVLNAITKHSLDASKNVTYRNRSFPEVFDKEKGPFWFLLDSFQYEFPDLVELAEKYRQGPEVSETIRRYEFVTFHQSYSYEEFVEGIRPVMDDDGDRKNIEYEIRPGIFRKICNRASQDPKHEYALFIDELNRGNVSKIFGEVITLMEESKREGMPEEIAVTLPYSGIKFSVPGNLHIIGTMNTADRSLALMDTALRRRFRFKELPPDCSLLEDAQIEGVQLDRLLDTLNRRIEVLYDREHMLGHSFFMKNGVPISRFDELQDVFEHAILPLLQEYFFEDWEKVRLVLGDEGKEPDMALITKEHPGDLFGESDLGSLEQPRYAVNRQALEKPEAYRAMYEGVSFGQE